MLLCEESEHDQREIILVCFNMNCHLKRACCLNCVENHSQHKQELQTFKEISKWKKDLFSCYQSHEQKMNQFVDQITKEEKYLSLDLEKSKEEITNDEFEKYISNLLSFSKMISPLNQIMSNLTKQMESMTQLFTKVDNQVQDRDNEKYSIQNQQNNQFKYRGQKQQEYLENQGQFGNQEDNRTKQNMKKYKYNDLIQKTYKLRKENDFDVHQYPIYYKSSIENLQQYKTIILVGTLTSKKQELINLFLNYYLEVEFSDPYRFEIFDDDIDLVKEDQNNEYEQMKVYYITPQYGKSGLRIINTPDYSDDLTFNDQQIFNRIYNVIQNSVSLNQNILISFVIPQQVQIGQFFMLESILSNFSNCLINNIVFLFPDCSDACPKQKDILQSSTEIINGMPSPVIKMIPTMNNSWYLKFNTSALFMEFQTQENQFLWDMGKNSFEQILENYLQNQLNMNKFNLMRNYYNQFLNYLSTSFIQSQWEFADIKQELQNQFLELYKRETFGIREFNFNIEKRENQIYQQIDKNSKQWNHLWNEYIYKIKNGAKSSSIIEKILKEHEQELNEVQTQINRFETLVGEIDLKTYKIGFEKFYDLFSRFINSIQEHLLQVYNEKRQYLKFNSLLISLNPFQSKYYEQLIFIETNVKQEGWEERVKVLTQKYNFYIYSDDYIKGSKSQKIEQILQEWAQYQFPRLKRSSYRYQKSDWKISIDSSEFHCKSEQIFFKEFKTYKCDQLIGLRISDDADRHFLSYIENFRILGSIN
ncbi:unnamed protein product (macronuclear) [Paramecium tetraurelia]|uniref:B box-type domain-containing protein n=1 Tax=Paramecium tetraurelia TaxID=5888 RepID=A0BJX2_PARTE|nr:uncharacterized protein GSPATT00029469001 [Paramecium tetraurelia]CAK58839.1 unnamed protein product [Paramecium tetraurelia]|eukprot:XP_001426237.1 hypothetical protein (macronuclear) [Paramecium tetraurelia strain d4-2]